MASNKQCFDKILISACFLGERVRYNGVVKSLVSQLLSQWQQQGRFISVCPEVMSGLPVPRPPAEINPKTKQVLTIESVDVSQQFEKGAQLALSLCQRHNIRFALLKESSPSCGSNTIYDGSFSQKIIVGEGITTKLLRQHGIKVFSELSLAQLELLLDQ